MRCSHCQTKGATIGCRVERCPHSFHLHCARAVGCTYYPEQYIVACSTHAPAFREEVEQEGAFLESPYNTVRRRVSQPSNRAPGKGKRKRTAEEIEEYIRTAHAAHKHARMESRRQSAESSDDEEHFQRKEDRRLARDKAKLNPVILRRPQPGEQSSMPGWELVGGLQHVVEQLKEMVILPLLYPELFSHLRILPPRGVLFHGEPGTGKTLAARALAGACVNASPHPVAFFARKGADCLGKFSGEAERTLRLLFEEAAAQAPAVIFLDELDGLLPARGTSSSASDQIYASVVSTMLALMDGIHDRGPVVIIGATNRPEAIDAALRRPGRFDREVYFGLPSTADRLEILKVHTHRWEPPPSQQVLQAVAAATQGFAGADLQALCAAAVMAAVNRTAPSLMQHLEQQSVSSQVHNAAGVSEAAALPADEAPAARDCGGDGASEKPTMLQPEAQSPGAAEEFGPHTGGSCEDGPGVEVAEAGSSGRDAATTSQEHQAETLPPATGGSAPASEAEMHTDMHAARAAAAGSVDKAAILVGVRVRASDWRAALAAAPEPCSRRQGLAAMAADAAGPMPAHFLPGLLPGLAAALRVLHTSVLPLPAAAASAAACAANALSARQSQLAHGGDAAYGDEDSWEALRTELVHAGALEAAEQEDVAGAVQHGEAPARLQHPPPPAGHLLPKSAALDQDAHGPCRLLVAGAGECGQPLVAGALLQLLGSSTNMAAVSLPHIVVAGDGDSALGCISTVRQAAQRASPGQLTVLFLPRIDGWAITRTPINLLESPEEAASPNAYASKSRSNAAFEMGGASMSSPFRGLVSLETRGSESPTRAWSTQQSPNSSRLSAGFSPFPDPGRVSLPHSGDMDSPLLGNHISGRLDQEADLMNGASSSAAGEAREQNAAAAIELKADGAASVRVDTEAVYLSELWMVFEQTLREVSPSHPLLVIATCHCKAAELPPLLTSFFCGGSTAGEQHASASLITLNAELPAREMSRAVACDERLLQGRLNMAHTTGQRGHQMSAAGKENVTSAAPSACLPAFNAAEKERGRQIQAQVEDGIRWCGQALMKDSKRISGEVPDPSKAQCCTSITQVAEAASHGSFKSLQEFQAAFHHAARQHRDARNKLNVKGDPSMAAIAAIQDRVDSWCFSIKAALNLNEPDVMRLLQASTS